jgi:hypothetical protein
MSKIQAGNALIKTPSFFGDVRNIKFSANPQLIKTYDQQQVGSEKLGLYDRKKTFSRILCYSGVIVKILW